MTDAEIKARKLISERTTEQLVSDFELTDKINDVNVSTVRGWIMDELEEARQGERNMRMAFGNQVSWAGVRKSRG
jgi:hypothetical protein